VHYFLLNLTYYVQSHDDLCGEYRYIHSSLRSVNHNFNVHSCYLFGVEKLRGLYSRRGLSVRSYGVLFAISTAMYFIAGTYWIVETVTVLEIIYYPDSYANQSPSSLDNKSMVLSVCLGLNFWLSDLLVLIRICILWKDNKLVQGISGLMFTTISILCLTYLTTAQTGLSSNAYRVSRSLPVAFGDTSGNAAILLSLGFNIWATALISFRLWKYKKAIRQSQSSVTALTRKSLSLLTEYGALYCLIWAAFAMFSAYRTPSQSPSLSYALNQTVVQVSGIYPTAIVVLVCMRQRVGDETNSIPELLR